MPRRVCACLMPAERAACRAAPLKILYAMPLFYCADFLTPPTMRECALYCFRSMRFA